MTYSRNPFYGRYEWKRTRRQVRLAAGFKCSMCGELVAARFACPSSQTIEASACVGAMNH